MVRETLGNPGLILNYNVSFALDLDTVPAHWWNDKVDQSFQHLKKPKIHHCKEKRPKPQKTDINPVRV